MVEGSNPSLGVLLKKALRFLIKIYHNGMYKVERKPEGAGTRWYEVMLSPFKTNKEAEEYIEKYRHCYPITDQQYRITKIK